MAKARAKTLSKQHELGIGGEPGPYRQGDLDGLCGPYCVVDAVRLAAHPQRRLREAECTELFAALVAELADIGRLRTAVTDGTGKVGRLARRAGCGTRTGWSSRWCGRSRSGAARTRLAACGW